MVFIPLVVVAILLQSYHWVPTYARQTAGNPERLVRYIDAGIGDAAILNPILNADSASANIVARCFDGLLDYDEELHLRGRLATAWQISEEAAFPLADGVDGEQVARRVRALLGAVVTAVAVEPPRQGVVEVRLAEGAAPVAITVDSPATLHLELSEVVGDLFDQLAEVMATARLAEGARRTRIRAPAGVTEADLAPHLDELLPLAVERPVIDFTLRRGVRFHDGQPFTAADVLFTYQAIMDPANVSPRTSDFEPIAAVEVVEPYRVRVVYKRLFSPAITAWTMGILPEHLLNRQALAQEAAAKRLTGELSVIFSRSSSASWQERAAKMLTGEPLAHFGMRDADFNRHPIGTGPFRFVSWSSDEEIVLARFDDYWEGPPEYRDYVYRILPDVFIQELEFRAGTIDSYGAEPHQVARYKKDARYQPFSRLGTGYTYLGYNLRQPMFQDVRVRRALGMAVDVEQIIRYLLYGEGEQVSGPYPRTTPWYDPEVGSLPFDPAAAGRLLDEAGWRVGEDGIRAKDGQRLAFTLITNHGNAQRKAIGTIVQDQWRKIGVDCAFQLFEWAVFLKDFINPGRFDACILGWSMGNDFDLYQLWHSSQTHPQQLNFVGYANPEADALIEQLRRTYDEPTQTRLARRLHARIAADAPYTFLFAPRGTTVLDRRIVVVRRLAGGREQYEPIRPTKSGEIGFYFNRWRKLAEAPVFAE